MGVDRIWGLLRMVQPTAKAAPKAAAAKAKTKPEKVEKPERVPLAGKRQAADPKATPAKRSKTK